MQHRILSRIVTAAGWLALAGFAWSQTPEITGVENGASFQFNISPGGIAVINGSDLATGAGEAGVSVSLGGAACYVISVNSPNALYVQLPVQLAPGTYNLTVSHDGTTSAPVSVTLAIYAPGIFTQTIEGGPAGFIDVTTGGNVVTSSAPARIGDVLESFGVGLGATNPPLTTGQITPSSPPTPTVTTPTVLVGGVAAAVSLSVLQPGYVGVYQVNFTVPTGLAIGETVVTWGIGGKTGEPVDLYVTGASTTITANGGSGSTSLYTQFPSQLSATVLDVNNDPISGAALTFSAPASGASAVFVTGTNSITVITDLTGTAQAQPYANGITGSYAVSATVAGSSAMAAFSMANSATRGSNILTTAASPSTGGVVTPPSGAGFSPGSIAQVSATENTGYTFSTWTGPVADPYANYTTVNMNASQSVSAGFIPQVFSDVPPSAYYFDAVNLLSQKGITSGCTLTTFCPTENVTRAEMAIFLVRVVLGSENFTYNPTPYFTDVQPADFAFQYIQKLYELGITSGCGPQLFCPNDSVTRAEMAVFIIRARWGDATFDFSPTPFFTDVPASAFGFAWIQRLKEDNITSGCTLTMYCPDDPVIRGDMAIFIMHAGFNRLLALTQPVLISVSPTTIAPGATATFTITGNATHFATGATHINATGGFEPVADSLVVLSPTVLTVQVTAPSQVPTYTGQPWCIWEVTYLGDVAAETEAEEALLPNSVTVVPPQ